VTDGVQSALVIRSSRIILVRNVRVDSNCSARTLTGHGSLSCVPFTIIMGPKGLIRFSTGGRRRFSGGRRLSTREKPNRLFVAASENDPSNTSAHRYLSLSLLISYYYRRPRCSPGLLSRHGQGGGARRLSFVTNNKRYYYRRRRY